VTAILGDRPEVRVRGVKESMLEGLPSASRGVHARELHTHEVRDAAADDNTEQ